MSIKDRNDNELVSLPGFWSFAFKFALVLAPVCATGFLAICGWTVKEIFSLDGRVRVLEFAQRHSNGGVSQSVNVGDASKAASATDATDEDSHRTWLTVAEVAALESTKDNKISERTIINWINETPCRIDPMPVKIGKSWTIEPNYRILPKIAAVGGNIPPDSENCETSK